MAFAGTGSHLRAGTWCVLAWCEVVAVEAKWRL